MENSGSILLGLSLGILTVLFVFVLGYIIKALSIAATYTILHIIVIGLLFVFLFIILSFIISLIIMLWASWN